ncbi:MAG: hypothetical protein H6720_20180 [Sandaracinus sp.]|nr:hypothetical protein [Sandaracinus sp.]
MIRALVEELGQPAYGLKVAAVFDARARVTIDSGRRIPEDDVLELRRSLSSGGVDPFATHVGDALLYLPPYGARPTRWFLLSSLREVGWDEAAIPDGFQAEGPLYRPRALTGRRSRQQHEGSKGGKGSTILPGAWKQRGSGARDEAACRRRSRVAACRPLRCEEPERLFFVTTRTLEEVFWLHPLLCSEMKPVNREARRAVDAKRAKLRKKLERVVAAANRPRPDNQPKLSLEEAERIAQHLVSSALARAQAHCAKEGLPPVEVFAVVVMSNHLHLVLRAGGAMRRLGWCARRGREASTEDAETKSAALRVRERRRRRRVSGGELTKVRGVRRRERRAARLRREPRGSASATPNARPPSGEGWNVEERQTGCRGHSDGA